MVDGVIRDTRHRVFMVYGVSEARGIVSVRKKKFQAICVDTYRCLYFGGNPAAGSPTATLLRLHPSHKPHRGNRPHEVSLATSGAIYSHGVTGGVYKARERIHRDILIRDY